ncbi:MAG: DUF4280 domain-containing protein [Burkholderiaceae bacterium]|nr:DUF4280 domain-containing protein [Burkholderiaceae bacterium]
MGKLVCAGAMLKCSFGMAPATLNVLPMNRVLSGAPAANIMDNVPMLNIMPFGMCQSLANPTVAAATAAAMGALTPMPCIPMTVAPWVPGSGSVMIASMPALNDGSKLICNWGGSIEISMAGQATVEVA